MLRRNNTNITQLENDPNVVKVYHLIKNADLNLDTLDDIIIDLIRIIQLVIKYKNKGRYKKKILLSVLHLLVDHSNKLTRDQKDILYVLINSVVPHTVDLLISVSKNQIDIGKGVKTCKTCYVM